MLDLELLEKRLDEVLSKETSETMTSWLLNRRLKKYTYLLGEGDFIIMSPNKLCISPAVSFTVETKIEEFSQEYSCEYDNEYSSAA
jgi:hypothetical protein